MPKDNDHIPDIMYDGSTKTIYKKREFFGKVSDYMCFAQ